MYVKLFPFFRLFGYVAYASIKRQLSHASEPYSVPLKCL